MVKEASWVIKQEKDDSAEGTEIAFSLGLTFWHFLLLAVFEKK